MSKRTTRQSKRGVKAGDADWKEFEAAVARIERALAPRGARVESPYAARVPGHRRARNVDAAIRMKVGSTDVLILVECRRRGKRGDQPWIEQLITRRRLFGASELIAVSSAGFSDEAVQLARENNIQLRTLNEFKEGDPQTLIKFGGVTLAFDSTMIVKVMIQFQGDVLSDDYDAGTSLPFSDDTGKFLPLIHWAARAKDMTAADLLAFFDKGELRQRSTAKAIFREKFRLADCPDNQVTTLTTPQPRFAKRIVIFYVRISGSHYLPFVTMHSYRDPASDALISECSVYDASKLFPGATMEVHLSADGKVWDEKYVWDDKLPPHPEWGFNPLTLPEKVLIMAIQSGALDPWKLANSVVPAPNA